MTEIAYISVAERGHSDQLLFAIADRLQRAGIRLAGVVQTNDEVPGRDQCDMNLHLLEGPLQTRRRLLISERLGPGSTGCRLNVGALEEAAGLTEAALEGAALLIVNKFGKREAEGGGFRPVIAAALERDIPVLTAAGPKDEAGLLDFAGEFARKISPDAAVAWACAATGHSDPEPFSATAN